MVVQRCSDHECPGFLGFSSGGLSIDRRAGQLQRYRGRYARSFVRSITWCRSNDRCMCRSEHRPCNAVHDHRIDRRMVFQWIALQFTRTGDKCRRLFIDSDSAFRLLGYCAGHAEHHGAAGSWSRSSGLFLQQFFARSHGAVRYHRPHRTVVDQCHSRCGSHGDHRRRYLSADRGQCGRLHRYSAGDSKR